MVTHPQTSRAIESQQERRRERMERDYERTMFRRVTIAGHSAVYVFSPSGAIYTVLPYTAKPVCNCPDGRERCAGTSLRCWHVLAVERWQGEAGQEVTMEETYGAYAAPLPTETPAPETDEERKARIYRQMRRDFPDE